MITLKFARAYVASRIYCRSFRSRLESSSTAEDSVAAPLSTTTSGNVSSRPVSKKEYGFMESAEILFTEGERPRIVGRWDWHAWQLFVSLLPPFGVYCLAMYAQKEMHRMEEEKRLEKEAMWEAELAEEEELQAPAVLKEQQMHERLEALEAVVKEMQAQLERPATYDRPEGRPQRLTEADPDEPGSDVPAASPATNKASTGWLRWLGLRRGRTPQCEDSNACTDSTPDPPEARSQSASAHPGLSTATQAASSRDLQTRSGDGQPGVQSTTGAAAEGGCKRQSGTSRAEDRAPERAGTKGSSGVLSGNALGVLGAAAGQQEPAQPGSGGWWPPSLAAWLLPGYRDSAGDTAVGSGQAAGQLKSAQEGSEGGRVWWPLNMAAWLLPGSTARDDHPSQRSPTEASGSSSVRSPAREAGSVESGGKSMASGEQLPLKARLPRDGLREPSQTPADRRMSEDQARDAEHYKKWREERRKRASNTESP